jgi:hypothetical protein
MMQTLRGHYRLASPAKLRPTSMDSKTGKIGPERFSVGRFDFKKYIKIKKPHDKIVDDLLSKAKTGLEKPPVEPMCTIGWGFKKNGAAYDTPALSTTTTELY